MSEPAIEAATLSRLASKDLLRALAVQMERLIDRRTTTRAGRETIVPFRGFGRGNELLLRGRVLAEKPITRATTAEPAWRGVLNAYRRFESDEIAGARVTASYRDAVVETTTDEEGYFRVRLEPREIDTTLVWHEVTLHLEQARATAAGQVIVPPPGTDFAVISDIDDTIVRTGATSLRTMVSNVVLENAATRMPFEGVSELYKFLHGGARPIFYVSSSPWNLYELLSDYMELHALPPGPMFLQDWGIDRQTLIHQSHQTHKLREIQSLLDFYPQLRFLLVGDSGQQDPEIYLQVIQGNPGRVIAAVIRDVTEGPRDHAVATIAEQAAAAGAPMYYVQDSTQAMEKVRGLVAGSR